MGSRNFLAAAACLFIAASAEAGPIWDEIGDAGSLPSTAQSTDSPVFTSLARIRGRLMGTAVPGGPDYVDMYFIRILGDCFNVDTAWAVTPGGRNDFNMQLWLFNAPGNGLVGNDDFSSSVMQSRLAFPTNDGTNLNFPGVGAYYLAVTPREVYPMGPGGPLFNQATTWELSGPDGPGGNGRIDGWSAYMGEVGSYDMLLSCAILVPEPASLLLTIMAGVCLLRRRRA